MSSATSIAAVSDLRSRESQVFDVERVRVDFPILTQKVHGKPLVYLDNAASAQKPRVVIEEMARFYREDYANVHRGVHHLSERATTLYEGTRARVRALLNAAEDREIVFVRGTTEAINLVAQTLGRTRLQRGDEVLISAIEHHSNIVPWQMVCAERGASLRVVPINDAGELLLDEYERLLGGRTKLVAITHVSNALGTVNPVRWLIAKAHERGIPVLIDGAQAVPHYRIDVRDLDCDFYAFSGHKVYGPSGVGVLYGKAKWLEAMPPYQGGGEMISLVTFEKTIYREIPHKFEAGTPNIAGVVGLGVALEYIESLGYNAIATHESDLLAYATRKIGSIPRVRLIGTAREKASVLSFVIEGIHPHDIGTVLDREGIAIRVGHHCAQPVMQRFELPATARASFALYNTREEVDALALGIESVIALLG
jgi:cysteine desulfurase/selenocysteine lyase